MSCFLIYTRSVSHYNKICFTLLWHIFLLLLGIILFCCYMESFISLYLFQHISLKQTSYLHDKLVCCFNKKLTYAFKTRRWRDLATKKTAMNGLNMVSVLFDARDTQSIHPFVIKNHMWKYTCGFLVLTQYLSYKLQEDMFVLIRYVDIVLWYMIT